MQRDRRTFVVLARWTLLFAASASATGCDLFEFPAPTLERDASDTQSISPDANVDAGGPSSRVGDLCSAATDSCHRTSAGVALTCFRASALGGDDFCAEACDPNTTAEANQTCVAAGALLGRCHPNDTADAAADCPPGFNCYRTSLTNNEGLCVRMPVCSTNGDCRSSPYHTCASSLITDLNPLASALFKLDHMGCTQRDCLKLASTCDSTQGCLAKAYSVVDICTPRCDSLHACPPNYSCAQMVSSRDSPDLCVPGVPGVRCDHGNCVIGTCDDTGAGFSICTIGCAMDDDCALFNTSTDQFVCLTGGSGRHCVTPRPFHGANCLDDSKCRADLAEVCAKYDPYGPTKGGECRVQCKRDGTCDPRAGLPHTCLGDGAGGCYPGLLGLPCKLQSECVGGLSCEDVKPETERAVAPSRICTLPCGGGEHADAADAATNSVEGGADLDCDLAAPINRGGYCNNGYCRLRRKTGEPCDRDRQCQNNCDTLRHICL